LAARPALRLALGVLTGLWVTVGAAVPIGYVMLRALKSANGGVLGPELLASAGVVLALLSSYGVAAAIGGWAARWVAVENRRELTTLLATSHAGIWLFAVAAGAAPFESGISLWFAVAAVLGTIAGVSARAWQLARRSRAPLTG
jgi:hypothetical protein